MEIYFKNSKVSSIISMSYTITTPRNISSRDKLNKSEKSTRKAVISAYGSDYNYIDYISIRHKNGDESDKSKNLDINWIKDNENEIYMQNPSPSEGETISWSGGYVQDGEYKFANGFGTTVWKNKSGEVVQVDERNFDHGQRQGQFKHQIFPSGNVIYSDWQNGKKSFLKKFFEPSGSFFL